MEDSAFVVLRRKEISDYETNIRIYRCVGMSFVISGIILFILPVITHFIGWGYSDLNLLGDYVGGVVSSVWSLAAMCFIYVAYLGQRIQISQQQIELDNNLNENKLQRFESTFFNLMQSHNALVSSVDFRKKNGDTISVGKDCFRTFYKHLKWRIRVAKKNQDLKSIVGKEEKKSFTSQQIIGCFEELFKKRQSDLGHYYRNLFMLFDFVITNGKSFGKERYLNIIISQLSSHETVFLYYFGLMKETSNEKKVIEDNQLLQYLVRRLLIDSSYQSTDYDTKSTRRFTVN